MINKTEVSRAQAFAAFLSLVDQGFENLLRLPMDNTHFFQLRRTTKRIYVLKEYVQPELIHACFQEARDLLKEKEYAQHISGSRWGHIPGPTYCNRVQMTKQLQLSVKAKPLKAAVMSCMSAPKKYNYDEFVSRLWAGDEVDQAFALRLKTAGDEYVYHIKESDSLRAGIWSGHNRSHRANPHIGNGLVCVPELGVHRVHYEHISHRKRIRPRAPEYPRVPVYKNFPIYEAPPHYHSQ